ncbi:Ion channel regulatory protein, partial [Aphelenchoides avenae]
MCRPAHSHTFNVTQLGIAFFFVFFAFNSQGFIEQTVVDTLAIIYFVFTFANFVAAPIVGKLKAKWSMVVGALTYGIFQAGFLFLNEPFLYISSAMMGIGAAVIWTAQGKYLSLNSSEETAGKHSGIFWAISQA